MRSILITGCRGGLGLELVKQILRHKTANPEILIATCRKISEAPELNDLASKNKNIHVLELELTNFVSYQAFATKVSNIVGEKGLNVLFHNAGKLIRKGLSLDPMKADELLELYKINSIAPIMLTKALLPLVNKASESNSTEQIGVNRAAVVCMSSILGSITSNTDGGYWGYRESKAAVNMAFRSMAVALKDKTIGTLMLHPGWVKTNMGGPDATLSVEESVNGLLPVLLSLSPKTNGSFIQYNGEHLPW